MIARLARDTGIDPDRLVSLDPPLFLAVQRDAQHRWTLMQELAALQVELLATIMRQLAGVVGGVEPFRLPRPGGVDEPPRRVVVSPLELAQSIATKRKAR